MPRIGDVWNDCARSGDVRNDCARSGDARNDNARSGGAPINDAHHANYTHTHTSSGQKRHE